MQNLWNDEEAVRHQAEGGELGLRVYTSRLLGADESLVLAGGGNTSVKLTEKNILGQDVELLYVKGSGWDLATIEAAGFAGVRMDHCLNLLKLTELSDAVMVNELKTHCTLASAPTPSVETLLHACLPFKYVDHTHADAEVTVTNLSDGEARCREAFGDRVLVIPYVMPGYDLAKYCADVWKRDGNDDLLGLVLLKHGIFSFGENARQSYDRMIDLVGLAEEYLREQDAWDIPEFSKQTSPRTASLDLASLRKAISDATGVPILLSSNRSERTCAFAGNENFCAAYERGTATPDHVIRTKGKPLLGRDVSAYAEAYEDYFQRNAAKCEGGGHLSMLDPAPRLVLDPELGLLSAGRKADDCS